ncbi:MAG: sorbitol dehydrogenase, partial [Verrucomicrobia bacterium]
HAVDRGLVGEGETVAVIGAGMIGLGAIAGAALEKRARVIAIDIDERKLEVARLAGAQACVNAATEPLAERLAELTGGFGPDVMIEAVGKPETFRACVDAVGYAGRVVYIGYAREPVSYETKLFLLKELDIFGSRGATRKDFDAVIAMLRAGRYPVAETITREVPFAEGPAAMEAWHEDPAAFTKIHIVLPGA